MQCLHPVKIRLSDEQRAKRFALEQFPLDYRIATHMYVPCGKCEACLVNRRSQWTFRLKQELRSSESAYFITLTYDDDHIPLKKKKINGVDCILPYVSKRDCQLFLKRFRKMIYPFKIRYFLVSEYGPKSDRPHYHMLLFDYPYHLKNKLDEFLEISWSYGFIRVDPVNDARIHYVTGYCLDGSSLPPYLDKCFMLCSRRPAIGYRFLDVPFIVDYCSSNNTDLYAFSQGDESFFVKIPRYYKDRLFDDELRDRITLKNAEYHSKSFDEISARQSAWLKKKGYDVNYVTLHTPYPSSPYDIEMQKKQAFKNKVRKNFKRKKDI